MTARSTPPDSNSLSPNRAGNISGWELPVRTADGIPRSPKPELADSPLTQQNKAQTFEPKIVSLYRQLLNGPEDDEKPDSFWQEFFLLKPDLARLHKLLHDADPEALLQNQHHTQHLLLHAIENIRRGGSATENALDTLTTFFAAILRKRFANPNSDVIEVLAGLDDIDVVFNDLVAALEHTTRLGQSVSCQQKAVKTIIAIVSGGYHTALVSYFIQRDLFPALMQLIHRLENPLHAAEPFLLMGLLANYNKFESPNQYRTRFADYVNDDTMTKIIESIAWTCTVLRERFTVVLDDTPAGWSLSGTLSYVGLGVLAGSKAPPPLLSDEQQRALFAEQPGPQAAMILTIYEFVLVNKLFAQLFLNLPSVDQGHPPPFSLFLSFASYLCQHAYRSTRASAYAHLTLVIFTVLVDDATTAKIICEVAAPTRLCRQKPPYLPLVRGDRTYASTLIDVLIDAMNGNLRKRLETGLYSQAIIALRALLTYLAKTKTKLVHHWSEVWRSLLSFVRFLTTYAADLQLQPGIAEVVSDISALLAFALSHGGSFLPDVGAYDDLVYKLIECGDGLAKLRDAYALPESQGGQSITTLIDVVKHYQELIETHKTKKDHLSPREVGKIIKQGYETLSIEDNETSAEQLQRYREIDHKVSLKKLARIAVVDATALVMEA